MKDLFRAMTLCRVAALLTHLESKEADYREVNGKVLLTPIQKQFFSRQWKNLHHHAQANLLVPSQKLSTEEFQLALNGLFAHHDLLRAQFDHTSGGYGQQIIPVNEFKVPSVNLFVVKDKEEMEARIAELQVTIDICTGPLSVFAQFELEETQYLFLSFHHLIMDLVSWRIIFADMESLLKGERLESKTMSFKEWSARLADFSKFNHRWSQHQVHVTNAVQNCSPNYSVQNRYQSFIVPAEITGKLDQVSSLVGANVQEILLACIVYAVKRLDDCSLSMRINLEGHGREPWDDFTDISRTVGWFTAIYPIVFPLSNDIASQLKNIQTILSNVPDKGITYDPDGFFGNENITIAFNYLGRFQGVETRNNRKPFFALDNSVNLQCQPVDEILLEDININCEHIEEQLVLHFDYSKMEPQVLSAWGSMILENIKSMVSAVGAGVPPALPRDWKEPFSLFGHGESVHDSQPLRIACLHGGGMNAYQFSLMMDELRQNFAVNAEFIYLQGYFETVGDTDEFYDGECYLWFDPTKADQVEYGMAAVEKQLKKIGPVDAILGWSQGATVLKELDRKYQNSPEDKWWNFSILVSGGSTIPNEKSGIPMDFPSLHIVGSAELHIVDWNWMLRQYDSQKLIRYEHRLDHVFPRSTDIVARMAELIKEMASAALK
jgi:hypothetical protein